MFAGNKCNRGIRMPKQVSLGLPKGYVQIQGLDAEDTGEAKALDNTTIYNTGTPGSHYPFPIFFLLYSKNPY